MDVSEACAAACGSILVLSSDAQMQEAGNIHGNPVAASAFLHEANLAVLAEALSLPVPPLPEPRDRHGYFTGLLEDGTPPNYWPVLEYNPEDLDAGNCLFLDLAEWPLLASPEALQHHPVCNSLSDSLSANEADTSPMATDIQHMVTDPAAMNKTLLASSDHLPAQTAAEPSEAGIRSSADITIEPELTEGLSGLHGQPSKPNDTAYGTAGTPSSGQQQGLMPDMKPHCSADSSSAEGLTGLTASNSPGLHHHRALNTGAADHAGEGEIEALCCAMHLSHDFVKYEHSQPRQDVCTAVTSPNLKGNGLPAASEAKNAAGPKHTSKKKWKKVRDSHGHCAVASHLCH